MMVEHADAAERKGCQCQQRKAPVRHEHGKDDDAGHGQVCNAFRNGVGKQQLNLVDVVGEDALDLPGAQFLYVAEGLLFQPVLQRNADVLERVVCADVRKGKAAAVGKCVHGLAGKNQRGAQQDELQVRQHALRERHNQLVQEEIGNNIRHNAERCKE